MAVLERALLCAAPGLSGSATEHVTGCAVHDLAGRGGAARVGDAGGDRGWAARAAHGADGVAGGGGAPGALLTLIVTQSLLWALGSARPGQH